jgi:two-component system phosphate regulon sensor histidine kinase PhoR
MATAGAAALLSLVVVSTILRPLGWLAKAARSVADGNLSERVTPRPSGEVGELADAFNQMTRSLEHQIAAASQERTRLMAALNSSIDAVIAVDADNRIAFANLAAEQLFLRSREDLVGDRLAWIMPDDQLLEALRASHEDSQRTTVFIERPNRQYLQVIITPIVGGGEWRALLIIRDLTDVKRVEQVRRDFVANVSHELRTPLSSIISVLETLRAGALEDRKVANDFLLRADMEVDRLVQMVEELLELSRIESGEVPLAQEPVEMGTVLARAAERIRPQAERQNLTLTLDVPSDLPPVVGDGDRLERASVNLLHNAVKFTPAGGSVHASAYFANGAVTVSVSDTGTGIDSDELLRVFERFYKADRSRGSRGTGLGLAVVKHTVEAHGGTVSVESTPGRGSTFSFSIPTTSPHLKR